MKDGESIVGKRLRIKGLQGRDHYIIVDKEGLMCTFPDNDQKNYAYQATAVALARLVSVAIQHGVPGSVIKKQLVESSMQKRDLPAVLLEALVKYENSGI